MPYLSEIQHRRVIEPNGNEIGTLKDLAVVPQGQFPAVQWAILATGDGERVVKWSDIAQEIGHLRLRGRIDTVPDAMLPPDALQSLREAVALCGPLPEANDLSTSQIIGAMARDKKSSAGTLNWILLDDIGRARVVNGNEIKPTLLRHSLRTAMKNFSSRQDRR